MEYCFFDTGFNREKNTDNFHICSWSEPRGLPRDQREWVFEVREVKSENKKLSLFFEKCKVKIKCFHSFWKSEIKMLRDRDREAKILENS